MADDWYDDIKMVNALKGGHSGTFRRNPVMEDFFTAAQGTQQLFANQAKMRAFAEAQEEKNALKKALGGMNMKKPEYGKLLALAPVFTQKLMATMTDANQEDRLKIGQAAKNTTDFLQLVMPQLKARPETRPYIARQLKQWGVEDDFIEAALPPAELAATDPQAYARSIDESLYGIKIIQENNKVNLKNLELRGIREKARLDLEKIDRKGDIDKALKAMSIDIAKINKTGKDYEITGTDGNDYIGKFTPGGDFKISPLPKGMKFREKKTGGGKGAGKQGLGAYVEGGESEGGKSQKTNIPKSRKLTPEEAAEILKDIK